MTQTVRRSTLVKKRKNDRILGLKCDYFKCQIIGCSQWPPLTLHWPLCRLSTDTDGPIDLRTAHAFEIARPLGGPCLSPRIVSAEIKACQTWKVAGQKFELKKREEEKREKNGGSLSCGALPLKASWPAICAGSLAIATTPGRERGERQPGKEREGGWDGAKGEGKSGGARQDGVDGRI